jgi:hypothetical protein
MDELLIFVQHHYPALFPESFLLFCTNILFFIIIILLLVEIRKLKRTIKNRPSPLPPESQRNHPSDARMPEESSQQNRT